MRVFLTGGTGYIGRSVARALVRAGHEVSGVARDPKKAQEREPRVRWVAGSLQDVAKWSGEARTADATVHMAADYMADFPGLDKGATVALLAAASEAKAPRTVVYTSGVWLLGITGDRAKDEGSPLEPAAAVVWRPGHEKLALAAGSPVTGVVVRPGMVYGGSAGLYAPYFADAGKGATYVGDGKNRWPGVHVDDLADLYLRVLELAPTKLAAMPAADRVFHATDGVQERVAEIARAAAKAAGGKDPQSFPIDAARKAMGPFADALSQDQVVASTRSESVLGWRPRVRGFVRNAAEMHAEWKRGA